MKPLIRWAGGKTKLVPEISKAFGRPSQRYLELFCGSASVFLGRKAEGDIIGRAVLVDSNKALINFHTWVRDDPKGLFDLTLEYLDILADKPVENYAYLRSLFNEQQPKNRRMAAMFWALNLSCFNGLYRENQKGEFNVPRGDRIMRPDLAHTMEVSRLFQKTVFEARDASDPLVFAGLGADQVYADPPYVPLSSGSFTSYTRAGFSAEDQRKLAKGLAKSEAHAVISNTDTPLTREIYSDYHVIAELSVHRSIAAAAGKRGKAAELLLSNRPKRS